MTKRHLPWLLGAIVLALLPIARPAALGLVIALILLVWLPLWWVVAVLGRSTGTGNDTPDVAAGQRARTTVAGIIAATAVASAVYTWLSARGLHQSSALFIGIPAILAILAVYFVPAHSGAGVAAKTVTVGLLISLMFLGEGVLCVLMSAPLFYSVAVTIGALVDRLRHREPGSLRLYSSIALLALVPATLEGVWPVTSFGRDEWVTRTATVHATAEQVEHAILSAPRFDRPLPLILRAGFPRPVSSRIEPGNLRWVVRMRGGEMRLDGQEPHPGDLVLQLTERTPGKLRWQVVSDGSHLTHYLNWRESIVRWQREDNGTTRVTWTLRYRRGLDPAWYFGPWERFVVARAADYLIAAVATP